MKRIFITLCAAASLVACTTDTETDVIGAMDSNKVTISPVITRATDTSFEDNDAIGLSITKAGGEVHLANKQLTYQEGIFSAVDVLWYTGSSETATLAAYYPYSEDGVPTSFTVQSDQSAGYTASDLMFSVVSDVEPTAEAVDMVFEHKLSNLVISTVSPTAAVESVKIVGINSTATVDVASESVEVKSGSEADITTLKSGEKFYAVVVPQTSVINFEVKVEGVDEPIVTSTTTATLESGKQHALTLYIVQNSGDLDADVSLGGGIYDWTGGADIDQDIPSVAFDGTYGGSYTKGEELTINVTVSGTDAVVEDVEWGTSDGKIATVKDGVVTFVGWGEVSIAARLGATLISADFTVVPTGTVALETPAQTEFTLDGDAAATSTTLTATIADGDATQECLVWESSNEDVATVEGGVVTFVGAGVVTISVSLNDSTDSVDLTLTKNLSDAATIAWAEGTSYDGNYMLMAGSLDMEVALTDADADDVDWASSDEAVATVDDNGKVTFLTYGAATITAKLDAARTVSADIVIPGGWWADLFNTYTGEFTVNSGNLTSDKYLFGSNSNTNVGCEGYIAVTTTNSPNWSKAVSIDGVAHNLNEAWRSDLWCMNEAKATINANVYPYFVIHIDNNIAKHNVVYDEFDINLLYSDGDNTQKRTINSATGYTSTAIKTDVRYLSDNTMLVIYDFSSFGKDPIIGNLTTEPTSYEALASFSVNYYMYGYKTETEVEGVTYPATEAFTFNIYGVQTCATEADIDAYIAAEGLTEVVE